MADYHLLPDLYRNSHHHLLHLQTLPTQGTTTDNYRINQLNSNYLITINQLNSNYLLTAA